MAGVSVNVPVPRKSVWFAESQPTFQRNISLPSLGCEEGRALLAACFMLVGFLFDPEDEGDIFLRNVG
jgi:hypothetical protein